MGAASSTAKAGFECLITRIFDAPRSLVFKAWVDPVHRAKWYGPRGFNAIVIHDDARTGGTYHYRMHSATNDYDWQGTYLEVVEPERLVFTWPNNTSWKAIDTVVTVTFEELGGKTRLTLRHATFPSEEMRDDHTRGWNSTLDRMAEVMGMVA